LMMLVLLLLLLMLALLIQIQFTVWLIPKYIEHHKLCVRHMYEHIIYLFNATTFVTCIGVVA
jgi:hypothetical protein